MKRLLVVGAALGALMIPAAASAHDGSTHDHACLDEACTVVSLFQDADPNTPGWQGTQAPRYGTWGFDMAGRDTSTTAGDDFFRYANGLSNDALEIPADRTSYGTFALLRELSDNRLKGIIETLSARTDLTPGSDEAKIADSFRSYMDEARVEALDAQPLQPYLAAIRAADSHEKMAAYMGSIQGRLGSSIFPTGISVDSKDPNRYIVSTGQGGLGLPNRDYYLDARYADKKEKYQAYVARMLEMIGWDDPVGSAAAVVAMEERIAQVHWTPIQSRDRDRTYNVYTPAQLAAEAPGFDFIGFLNAAELGGAQQIIVRQNTAMAPIAAIFAETPIATLQAWQAFQTTDDAASRLSRRFSDAQWEFRTREMLGQPEQRSREMRAVAFAGGALPEGLGRLYAAEYFPPESKAKMEELVANLRVALSHRIDNLTWMGAETKAAAQAKLAKFEVRIGYPDKWRDYSSLEIRADDLFGNAERIGLFNWRRQLSRMNGPVDRTEWGMMPQTVNASYNSVFNVITFPAGILQPPFFDPDADPAVNYGAIGGVIGHEIGHGFDDQGSKSDGDGVLRDWWTPQDRANFVALTTRLGAQYDQFEVLPGYNVQGALTMGENIGDAAGVAVGLDAYHLSLNGRPSPVIEGTTGDQRFFYAWAQVWNSRDREEALKQAVSTNVHSPARFRVIGPVRNVDAWYDAFDVQPGQTYYLPPEQRVCIW